MFYVETIDKTGRVSEVFGPYRTIKAAFEILTEAYDTQNFCIVSILDYADELLFSVSAGKEVETGNEIRYKGDIIKKTEKFVNWNPDGLDGESFSLKAVSNLIGQLLEDVYKPKHEPREWITPLKIPTAVLNACKK